MPRVASIILGSLLAVLLIPAAAGAQSPLPTPTPTPPAPTPTPTPAPAVAPAALSIKLERTQRVGRDRVIVRGKKVRVRGTLAPFVAGPCIVAIDAPLLVTNATGNRDAEKELNADFAKFQAGAHPTNQGKPEFTDGDTRVGRLARRLGLDLNPRSGR